jgi:hypothetical protein
VTEPKPTVDVLAVMREIQASLQRRRERGLFSEEDVEALADLRRRAAVEDVGIDPYLLKRLFGPSHDWNIRADYPIRSHREGLPARLIVLAKRLLAPFVRLYTDQPLNRQAQLNLYVHYLLRLSLRELSRLRLEHDALRHRLEELEAGRPPGPR